MLPLYFYYVRLLSPQVLFSCQTTQSIPLLHISNFSGTSPIRSSSNTDNPDEKVQLCRIKPQTSLSLVINPGPFDFAAWKQPMEFSCRKKSSAKTKLVAKMYKSGANASSSISESIRLKNIASGTSLNLPQTNISRCHVENNFATQRLADHLERIRYIRAADLSRLSLPARELTADKLCTL